MFPLDTILGEGLTRRALDITTINGNRPTMTQAEQNNKIFITLIWPDASQSLILDVENLHVTWGVGFCDSVASGTQQEFAATLAGSLLPLANEIGFKTTSLMALDDMADFLEQQGMNRKDATTLEADLTNTNLLKDWRPDA